PILVALANFSGQPRQQVRVGVPRPGRWKELVNTDADYYGGSGVGNLGAVEAVDEPHQGQPHSLVLTLPPLGMLWLVPETVEASTAGPEAEAGTHVEPADGIPHSSPDPDTPPTTQE